MAGGTVTLDHCTVSGNYAVAHGGCSGSTCSGGGIYMAGS